MCLLLIGIVDLWSGSVIQLCEANENRFVDVLIIITLFSSELFQGVFLCGR